MSEPAGPTGSSILVVEDDKKVRSSLLRALRYEGYKVIEATDGLQGLAVVEAAEPDLVLVDMMMPNMDGLSMCRRLRDSGDRRPVLMLTARSEVADRVAGLDAGADDYLAKPFALDELFARIRALLRRTGEEETSDLQVGDLLLDLDARRAVRNGLPIELTKTEFDLLHLLMQNVDIVLEHTRIYERIWGYDFGGSSKSLAVYIGYLRRKTEEGGRPRMIHTVRGVGYTLRAA